MMKKIMIMALLSVFSIFIFNQTMHSEASFKEEPAVNAGGLWHVEDGNRAYVYMRYTDGSTVIETGNQSNSEYPGYDYSHYTLWQGGSENNFSYPNQPFTKTAFVQNPDPTLYDTFNVEIIPNMMTISGPEPTFKTVASYTSEVVSQVTIDLFDWEDRPNTNYLYDYSYITLDVDGTEILTSRNVSQSVSDSLGFPVNPNFADMSFGVRMYWEKSTTEVPIDPGTSEDPWSLLPATTGNPTNPVGDWGTVSSLNVVGQQVSFNVEYNGVNYPVNPFIVEGNLDFTSEVHDILYYTDPDNGDRIMYFNFGETLDSAILTATSFDDVNEWKGEALWNLTQNQIKVTDVLRVYNYIPEVDADGNVFSYFYMPDVPMENLISVSATLAYRYWSDGILNLGNPEPGEIQYKNVAAVKGESTSVNPTWVEDAYKMAYISSATATAILTYSAVSGVVPVYGWAIAGAGFLIGAGLQASDANEWFAYDVEQIQHVIPDVALASEINTYIDSQNPEDTFTADTDKLYKLHLATLQDHDDVEVMGDLSNVTQVVWETDGEIFVVNEENIDDIEWGGPGTLPPPEDFGNSDLELIIYTVAGLIGIYIIGSFINFKKNKGLLIILGAGAVYILYRMGLI